MLVLLQTNFVVLIQAFVLADGFDNLLQRRQFALWRLGRSDREHQQQLETTESKQWDQPRMSPAKGNNENAASMHTATDADFERSIVNMAPTVERRGGV